MLDNVLRHCLSNITLPYIKSQQQGYDSILTISYGELYVKISRKVSFRLIIYHREKQIVIRTKNCYKITIIKRNIRCKMGKSKPFKTQIKC